MKSRVALFAAAWLASGLAFAAPPERGPGPNMDRMALLLDLNDQQKAQVEKILQEQREERRAAWKAARDAGQERPTRAEMEARREQMKQETVAKLQGVLSDLQIKKFEALMERPPHPPGPPAE